MSNSVTALRAFTRSRSAVIRALRSATHGSLFSLMTPNPSACTFYSTTDLTSGTPLPARAASETISLKKTRLCVKTMTCRPFLASATRRYATARSTLMVKRRDRVVDDNAISRVIPANLGKEAGERECALFTLRKDLVVLDFPGPISPTENRLWPPELESQRSP